MAELLTALMIRRREKADVAALAQIVGAIRQLKRDPITVPVLPYYRWAGYSCLFGSHIHQNLYPLILGKRIFKTDIKRRAVVMGAKRSKGLSYICTGCGEIRVGKIRICQACVQSGLSVLGLRLCVTYRYRL